MSPMTFWLLQEQDQAFMISYQRAKGKMQSYEDHLHAKEMQRKSRSVKKR